MATTVAHGLIGICAFCAANATLPAGRRLPIELSWLVIAFVAANLPDIDIIFGLVLSGNHSALHGGVTHSLAFATFCTLVALVTWRDPRQRIIFALLVGFLVVSHIIVDTLTGPQLGLHEGSGTPLLWPFVRDRITMPITAFKGVNHGNLFPDALFTAAFELMLLTPAAAAASYFSRRRLGPTSCR
jgi:membrane-bound metal-dependent hydrolase YbcI (DUF457 family)